MKERSNETLSYMIYMANRWDRNEAIHIYGESLGEHIWNKYVNYCDMYHSLAAISKMVYELDTENLNLLLDRACELYDGRRNR